QREFHQEILQAKQAGSGRRIKEFCPAPFYAYKKALLKIEKCFNRSNGTQLADAICVPNL
ncbi:hypothetical protein, partial [Staphylococcus sp. GDY8P57P]|uniref:hypothetical protein n=1 Tax=Staphylococcus sp. GDY8P57P TaxID=2804128 RepID=UPI001AEBFAB3